MLIRQPGPVALRSLRANLVGSEHKSRMVRVEDETKWVRSPDTLLMHKNFFDVRDVRIMAGEESRWLAELPIPEGLASGKDGSVTTSCKIEVWGRVRFYPGFMHSFPIRVRRNLDK